MQHENIIILMIIFNFCMIQVYELQNVDIMQQLSKYRLTIKSVKCLQCFDAVGWVAGRASGL